MATFLDRMARVARRAAGAPPEPALVTKAAPAFALYTDGRASWTARDPAALARAGYQRNPIVHRAVRLVAEGAASLPLMATGPGAGHAADLLALLARPNPRESGTRLLETVYADLTLSGTAYLEAVSLDGRIAALQSLRPGRMRMLPGPDGWPVAYVYTVGGNSRRFDLPAPGAPEVAPILALSLFHPDDDYAGLAPIEAAATALDIHNAASAWNKGLLDNAARPSGALVFAGAALTEPQFDRLKAELEANYQGAANAGRPLLLEGGLDWKPLALSPRDMDFVEAKNAGAGGGRVKGARRLPRSARSPFPLCGLSDSPIPGCGAVPLSRAGEGQGEGCALSGKTCPLTPTLSRTGEGARGGFRKPRCEHRSPQRGGGERLPFLDWLSLKPRPLSPSQKNQPRTLSMDGHFSGYASVFGVPDLGRDVVVPGAFAASLARRGAAGVRLLLAQDMPD
ncbi:phage portal protein [Methylobacterium sp. WL7]|uniref:phage portal protein n=1 Tax=Methylobacterium sp. WL7 TaxID=2603900 RepID=UPI001FEFA8D1|nr:phage portal protein [Methylobacterium sp. WL7]